MFKVTTGKIAVQLSFNGAKRARTADPYNAIVVLYQLSYSPFLSPFFTIPRFTNICQVSLQNYFWLSLVYH